MPENYDENVIKKLSEKYGFSEDEAKNFLDAENVDNEKVEPEKEKVDEKVENSEKVIETDEKVEMKESENKSIDEQKDLGETKETIKSENSIVEKVDVEKSLSESDKLEIDTLKSENKTLKDQVDSLNAKLNRFEDLLKGVGIINESGDIGLQHDISPKKADNVSADPLKRALQKANSY